MFETGFDEFRNCGIPCAVRVSVIDALLGGDRKHPRLARQRPYIIPVYDLYTMAVVPLRLSEDDIKALDALVKAGIYKNRSEAARALIRDGARLKAGEMRNVSELVRQLLRESKRKNNRPFSISRSTRSAVELVAEGRGQ